MTFEAPPLPRFRSLIRQQCSKQCASQGKTPPDRTYNVSDNTNLRIIATARFRKATQKLVYRSFPTKFPWIMILWVFRSPISFKDCHCAADMLMHNLTNMTFTVWVASSAQYFPRLGRMLVRCFLPVYGANTCDWLLYWIHQSPPVDWRFAISAD